MVSVRRNLPPYDSIDKKSFKVLAWHRNLPRGTAMTNTPLRAGMLGVGTIATIPSGFLPGLMEMKQDVTLVAAADPVLDRTRSVAAQYGIPEVYSTLDEML